MTDLLGLGVFGTFGKPFGFQQVFYVGTEYYFDKVFNSTLDLNTNSIELFPNTELYAVKRELSNGILSICICKYSYANEINSNRGGTFIGSCILLKEAFLDASVIYSFLEELHNDLVSSEKNIINSKLQVSEAIQLHVNEPTNFDKAKSQLSFLKDTEFYSLKVNQTKKFLIVPKANEDSATQVKAFIENSIQYFNDVDTLYFTFDEKIITYVNQKGILKSINWQTFVDRKEEVIKERAEKRRIDEERKIELERNNQSKNHTNNDDSFTNWTYKKQKWGKSEVKKRVDEHNKLFEYCYELQNQKSNTPMHVVPSQPYFERQPYSHWNNIFEDYKFLISVILNLLLVLTIVIYIIFFNSSEVRYITISQEEVPEQAETKKDKAANNKLEPVPNSELNSNDRMRIERIGLKGRKGKDIIQFIFTYNPNEIQLYYKDQVDLYLEYLIAKNPDCFTKEDDICNCDSLVHIPSFKKDNQ
ncbi:MAG: hypothetical protein IPG01_11575 [Chitinophagaceae bacterium]|nr:hypothetical protein [Chitinophagaceae bacterium]